MADYSDPNYSTLLAALSELDLPCRPIFQIKDAPYLRFNEELGFAFRLHHRPRHGFIELQRFHQRADGTWKPNPMTLEFTLDGELVENVKQTLRQWTYPVDRILRTKRLRALVE